MAEIIRMPRLSDTMEEGNIVEWHVSEGDDVEAGDVLAEVETDKATMEVESFFDGKILHIDVDTGAVPVNSVIAVIGEEGEDYEELLQEAKKSDESDSEETDSEESEDEDKSSTDKSKDDSQESKDTSEKTDQQDSSSHDDKRIKASPLAKRMAEDKNIDLKDVNGSGDGGRIVKRDIESFEPKKAPAASTSVPAEDYEDIEVSQMRKTIARRLAESKFQAPHFYLTVEIDMDNIVKVRKELNNKLEKEGKKLSFNDFVLKSTAAALKKHPEVNSSWKGDKIRKHKHVNLGVAVAVEEGLVVPVINNAASLPMTEINKQVRELAEKAQNKNLQTEEMQGNTFTVSNLGMYDIEEFTAIINPPDACILAVGTIQEKPVVKDGELAIGHRMKVTLSCDHRVVDGATGAKFLQTLKNMLENPVFMLV